MQAAPTEARFHRFGNGRGRRDPTDPSAASSSTSVPVLGSPTSASSTTASASVQTTSAAPTGGSSSSTNTSDDSDGGDPSSSSTPAGPTSYSDSFMPLMTASSSDPTTFAATSSSSSAPISLPPSTLSNTPPSSRTAFASSRSAGTPIGAIVGPSVGGGAIVLILAVALAFCMRRRSRRQRIAPSSEFLHPEAQEQFRYARSAHTMSMDSGLLSASMEKFPASPPLPSISPQLDSFFSQGAAASPSGSRQSTLSTGSPPPAIYSHRARASSAGSVALSSLYVSGDHGMLRGGSPLQGFALDSQSPLSHTLRHMDSESDGLHIVHEDSPEIGVAR